MKQIIIGRLIGTAISSLIGVVVYYFIPFNLPVFFIGVLLGHILFGYLEWHKLKDADVKMVFTATMGVEMPQEMFEQYTTAFPNLTFKSASVRRKYLLFGSYIYKLKFI